MTITIPYRKDTLEVSIQKEQIAGIIEPNDVETPTDSAAVIAEALKNPIGSESFEDFISRPGSLLVIVNDGTRPTPTRQILETIQDSLAEARAEFIIATGVHRGPTREEYDFIFGSTYDRFKHVIHVHDARKTEDMIYLGDSKNGTSMYINKIGVEADKVLIIGSVEPHYFAGYTGGRKGFLPGIAAYSTIEQNHKHALSPKAKALALEGNPVHEDMIDAMKVINKPVFTIMTVLEKHHKLYSVTAGNIYEAFNAAIAKADEVFVAPIEEKADVVVTVAKYPMDVDLYQAQKAIDNGKLALKSGGTMILVASCREGLGEEAFVRLLSSSDSPETVLEKISESYKLGYHKAGKMAEIFQWATMMAFTDLQDDLLEQIFIKPVHNLQQAIEAALVGDESSQDKKVLFLLDGCVTVPQPKNM